MNYTLTGGMPPGGQRKLLRLSKSCNNEVTASLTSSNEGDAIKKLLTQARERLAD